MARALEPRVAAVEKDLKEFKTEMRHSIDELKRTDALMLEDIAKINARLGETATKADLANSETRITTAFYEGLNSNLKGALESIPEKYAARWTAINAVWAGVGAVAGVAIVVVGAIEAIHHFG